MQWKQPQDTLPTGGHNQVNGYILSKNIIQKENILLFFPVFLFDIENHMPSTYPENAALATDPSGTTVTWPTRLQNLCMVTTRYGMAAYKAAAVIHPHSVTILRN